ncbi:uncharacterized protein N7479_003760 [Penicillium vulpinum]|uniref:uncharacterized protein n=1 Tax=Penicillium vulpinum TaxID=29845 RepID=UPI002548FF85|nr:uncharacterized protein N7479_003760 [Penicillium vulpinum]KAJ5963884.1 hypothetical protein N7479_003760 [Penicillium vulpinum]
MWRLYIAQVSPRTPFSVSLPKGRPTIYKPKDIDGDPPSTPLLGLTPPPPAPLGATAGQSIVYSIKPACISGIPGLILDWDTPTRNAAEDQDTGSAGPVPVEPSPHVHGQSEHTDRRRSIISMTDSGASSSGAGPDVVIGQLSKLSFRLSALGRLADEFARPSRSSIQTWREQAPIDSKLVIDATAFASVALWVAHGSAGFNSFDSTRSSNNRPTPEPEMKTPGGILYYLFSASHFLLQIIRGQHLHVEDSALTPSMPTTPPSLVESNPFDNAIRHLCIGCYSSLINAYISVINILGHDVELSNHGEKAILGDIRLISIVQICSYLTERQNQAIGSYLFAESSTSVSPPHEDSGENSHEPVLQSSNIGFREDTRCLKMEVQERLLSLQQILTF